LNTVLSDPAGGAGKVILSISHSELLIKHLGLEQAKVIEANYPEYDATDLSAFTSGDFDYVFSDQVLEHVEGSPQSVFDETLRLLKPGGIAVHTTCFINPIHGWPSDFWRFTPNSLSLLAKSFSEIIEVGGFGNRATWVLDFLEMRYTPIPHAKWHPLHKIATRNNPSWPTSTWIVARKGRHVGNSSLRNITSRSTAVQRATLIIEFCDNASGKRCTVVSSKRSGIVKFSGRSTGRNIRAVCTEMIAEPYGLCPGGRRTVSAKPVPSLCPAHDIAGSGVGGGRRHTYNAAANDASGLGRC
jgi:hypothetical protein